MAPERPEHSTIFWNPDRFPSWLVDLAFSCDVGDPDMTAGIDRYVHGSEVQQNSPLARATRIESQGHKAGSMALRVADALRREHLRAQSTSLAERIDDATDNACHAVFASVGESFGLSDPSVDDKAQDELSVAMTEFVETWVDTNIGVER